MFFSGDKNALDQARQVTKPINRFSCGFTAQISHDDYNKLNGIVGLHMSSVPSVNAKGTISRILHHASRTSSQELNVDTDGERNESSVIPWGISSIYNNTQINSTSGGGGIIVAVLDTGVSPHPDLKAPLQCRDYTNIGIVVEDQCLDGHGHGTFTTGTILASTGDDGSGIWGIAPGTDYYAYKVLNDAGLGYEDTISVAIRDAVDQGAHIINLSLGDSQSSSPFTREALQHATSRGVLVLAASGNDGPGINTINYPAALSEVASVGALQMIKFGDSVSLNNLAVANFSSRGVDGNAERDGIQEGYLEFSAPGAEILSTYLNEAYAIGSGTSFSCPHVAGLAAKLWSSDGGTTRSLLQQRAVMFDIYLSVGGGTDTGYDPASGFGEARV